MQKQEDLRSFTPEAFSRDICENAFREVSGSAKFVLENQEFNVLGLTGRYQVVLVVKSYTAKLGYRCEDIVAQELVDDRGRFISIDVKNGPRILSLENEPINFQEDVEVYAENGILMDILQWTNLLESDETIKNNFQLQVRKLLFAEVCAKEDEFEKAWAHMQVIKEQSYAELARMGWEEQDIRWTDNTEGHICTN